MKQKSIVVSFRLKPLIIAKAIDGLKAYDKGADIGKLSSITKQVFLHGVNYMTGRLPWEPSEESQRIVWELTSQGKNKPSFEDEILKPGSAATPKRPSPKYKEEFLSTKSTVTDFSIPKEMIEDLKKGDEE